MAIRDITLFWAKLKRQVATRGGISYSELKALEINEFFVILSAYEAEVKAEFEAHKKATKKTKK